jgi:hypothetical protein
LIFAIDQQIKDLYQHCTYQNDFETATVLVLTEEGQVLTQFGRPLDDNRIHQSGVLMAGAWQASITLLQNKDKDQILSLGDSNSGFFIAPFTHHHTLLIGVIFNDHLNPGLLKMKTKLLRNFMSENLSSKNNEVRKKNKEDYLFKNITDEELNRLFSFAGI